MTSKYDKVTKNKMPMMAIEIGTTSVNAARPMYGVIWVRICSVP